MPHGTMEIAGHDCTITVSTSSGYFSIDGPDGKRIGQSLTLENAKEQARRELAKRKVRVKVPFRTIDGYPGAATGLHAGTRKVLAKIEKPIGTTGRTRSVSVQLDRAFRNDTFKEDTPESVFGEIKALRDEIRTREGRIHELQDKWMMNLHQTVEEAIETAAREEAG